MEFHHQKKKKIQFLTKAESSKTMLLCLAVGSYSMKADFICLCIFLRVSSSGVLFALWLRCKWVILNITAVTAAVSVQRGATS